MDTLLERQLSSEGAFSHALRRDAPSGCVDLDAFRAGMRIVAGAVNILTTRWCGERYGLTATAVCSLSAEPPRLIACINQRGVTFNAMRQSGVLAANVLSDAQAETAERFAGMRGNEADRFGSGDWEEGRLDGVPVLAGACCSFECRVSEIIDSVSHAIVIGDIFHVTTGSDASPLLYCDGAFAELKGARAGGA